MKRLSYHKLRAQIAAIIIIMLTAIIILSFFLFKSFSDIISSKNIVSFSQNSLNYLNYTENQYKVIPSQMSWISGSVNQAGYFENESLWDRSMYSGLIRNNLQGVITTFDSIEAAVIIFSDSHVIIESHRIPENRFLNAMNVIRGLGSDTIQIPRTASLGDDGQTTHLLFSQLLYSYNKIEKRQSVAGTIYFFVDPQALLPEDDTIPVSNVLLLDKGSDQVFLSDLPSDINLDPQLLSVTDGDVPGTILIGGETYRYYYQRVAQSNLFLLSLISADELRFGSGRTILVGSALLLIVSIFAVFSIWFLTSEITNPLRRIEDGMNRIRGGEFDYRLAEKGNSELTLISNGVNQLLDRLRSSNREIVETQERLYESELLQRDSRIRMLQFQINPHFLYNTLECIRSIAQNYHIQELIDIVGALIGIFRYNTSGDRLISLREELVCCQYYAKIIGIRFSNKYSFEFDYSDEILDHTILKMTLQPILENAVLHGLAERPGPGRVLISIRMDGDSIRITVEDNGVGINADDLDHLIHILNSPYDMTSGETVGLRNVHQRLIYEYGEKSGLSIKSEPDSYTIVSFIIPSAVPDSNHETEDV